MKISKALGLALMVALLVAGWTMSGQAASISYVCTVNAAGPTASGTGARIFLTDTSQNPSFPPNQEFQVPRGQANQFLAVALEAISLGKTVSITANLNASPTPILSSIYLQNQ